MEHLGNVLVCTVHSLYVFMYSHFFVPNHILDSSLVSLVTIFFDIGSSIIVIVGRLTYLGVDVNS